MSNPDSERACPSRSSRVDRSDKAVRSTLSHFFTPTPASRQCISLRKDGISLHIILCYVHRRSLAGKNTRTHTHNTNRYPALFFHPPEYAVSYTPTRGFVMAVSLL